MGTRFLFDCTIDRIEIEQDRVSHLSTSAGALDADAYVLALGVEAPRLARPIGIDLPIYPVKGYSATFPVGPGHRGPLIGGLLEDQAIAFSRLGDRLRVTSVVEIAGYDATYRAADFTRMIEAFRAVMPDAADYDQPEYWACLRPMTPTGQPVVGSSRYRNLYFNAGHGSLGWTMCCGTARLVADVINDREPAIPLDAMRPH
jgi:D-amino-acid dehydrogenase